MRKDYIFLIVFYILVECVYDFFDMVVRLLVMGGRLVYFFFVVREDCFEFYFFKYFCFILIVNSE